MLTISVQNPPASASVIHVIPYIWEHCHFKVGLRAGPLFTWTLEHQRFLIMFVTCISLWLRIWYPTMELYTYLNIKAAFYIPENRPNFSSTKGFKMNISMKLVYHFMTIFFTFSPTSTHLHPPQVENCDSNSRLVVDEDDDVKSGLKGLNKDWTTGTGNIILHVELYIWINIKWIKNVSTR